MSKQKQRPSRKKRETMVGVVGYSVPEVGALLGVSANTVYSMIERGELESARVGRLIRVLAGPFHAKYGDAIPA
jgi:excisionase family DNA binding protein